MKVPADQLGKLLGTRSVNVVAGKKELAPVDLPLDHSV